MAWHIRLLNKDLESNSLENRTSRLIFSVGNSRSLSNVSALLFTGLVLPAAMGLFAGCVSTVTNSVSMLNSAQTPPNPKQAALDRTAIAADFIRQGNLDAAAQMLDRALTSDPHSPEANNMMGVLLQQEGSEPNQIKAEEYFKRAISYRPDFAQAHNNYGVFLNRRKRYVEAYEQFQIAGTQLGYNDRAAALENLGLTALVLGKQVEAEDAFKDVLRINSSSLTARLELADIFYKQNRIRDAQTLYNQYLQYLSPRPQSPRSLWLGMRIANQTHDEGRLASLANQLQLQYPNSQEYQHYNELLKSGAAWN